MNYSYEQIQAQERATNLPSGTEFYFNEVWNAPPSREGRTFHEAVEAGQVPGVIALPRDNQKNKSLYKRV
jgi:hypothetical protein